MSTLRAALREAIEQLTAAQVPSASLAAELLLLHVLDRDRTFLYAHPQAELSLDQQRAYRHLLGRRSAGTPTQYLTGRQEFWGLPFTVAPGVFIPRPETEHVVEVVLAIVRERLMEPGARIVDVGTGTGCIALALASELPLAEIFATDISDGALALAGANAEALGLIGRVQFLRSDLLEVLVGNPGARSLPAQAGTLHDARFDVIVSNPPYISPDDASQLPREVLEHEPAAALFSPDEGLAVTRRLIEQASQLLAPSGYLALELGYQMSGRVKSLLGEGWTNVEVTPDLRGIPRVLSAQRIGATDGHG
ncbi:MAG: peptide chain release factor N(5)-glutamine methyltransferase [Candidatus Acidiferrales bacterium]